MFGYVILGFVVYFLYRFVAGFVLPIWKSTKAVRQNIRNMQNQQASHSQADAPHNEPVKNTAKKSGDYIDFEEIKDNK